MTLLRDAKIYVRALAKWGLLSAVVGVFAGLVATLFRKGVHLARDLRIAHGWLLFLLPLIGLLIVLLFRVFRTEDQGTNNIIRGVHSGEGLTIKLVPSVLIATVLTHLGGGSAGRAAELLMGGSLGHFVGRSLRLDDQDVRTATMVGMAAFFSTVYGTPLTGTVLAMTIASVGIFHHAAFLPCLLSSLISYGTSRLLGVEPMRFAVTAPKADPMMMLRVALLASIGAFVSVLFCFALQRVEKLERSLIKNPWLRIFVAALVIVGLSLIFSSGRYNGGGNEIFREAIEEGRALPFDFLIKILFTAITLGAGFKGGEIIPSFFIGATFGCVVGPLLGVPAGFAAAIGLIAVFCGAVNCPLAAIFLGIEFFGAGGLLYYGLTCGLAFVLSGYSGIYSSQQIIYDKLKTQYINAHTNGHRQGNTRPGDE